MLAGTSYGVSPCTDFVELFDGTAERTHGKEKATQAKLSLFGWFEGYMEGFRLATAYTRPEWIGDLTGLHLTKIVAELKDYCTTHPAGFFCSLPDVFPCRSHRTPPVVTNEADTGSNSSIAAASGRLSVRRYAPHRAEKGPGLAGPNSLTTARKCC
jgi:hypothetical protein